MCISCEQSKYDITDCDSCGDSVPRDQRVDYHEFGENWVLTLCHYCAGWKPSDEGRHLKHHMHEGFIRDPGECMYCVARDIQETEVREQAVLVALIGPLTDWSEEPF